MRISDWSSDVCSSDLRSPGECRGRVAAAVRALHYPRAQEVMHVQRTNRQLLVIDDYQRTDLVVFHDLQSLSGEHLGMGGLAVHGHDLVDARLANVDSLVQRTAQVAVGEDAGESSVRFDDDGHRSEEHTSE